MHSNLFGWAATRQHLAVALRAKQQRLVDRAELPLCMESSSAGAGGLSVDPLPMFPAKRQSVFA